MKQHRVQFYEDENFLNGEIIDFVGAGIAAGEICIVIAGNGRLRALEPDFERHVARAADHAGDAQSRAALCPGRYLLLDADAMLQQIAVDGWPDEQRFIAAVGNLIAEASQRGGVRVFGEMVALLCAQGRHDAALQLEEFWNALDARYPISLLCAYPKANFADATLEPAFRQICAAHTHTLPAESFRADDSQAVCVTIANLQQRAWALESEVARRKHTEALLKQRESELSDFLENAVEGLHRVDADGRISWANRVELDLLGYLPHEYIGHHVAEFHVDHAVCDDILARQRQGETLLDYPLRLRCRNGSVKHVLMHSNAWMVDGAFMSTRCFIRDVTDQVHLARERDQRRRDRQAERLLRMANGELEMHVRERTANLEKINAQLSAEVRERKHAERALQQSQQLLRELGQHTAQIIEDERKRIARELHDQLGQNLMALRIDVLMMQTAAGDAALRLAPTVDSALHNIDSMIKNVRSIINNLRPAVLDLGLAATVEWEIKEFERRSGIHCTLSTDCLEYEVDDARALALLRILQESLNNVLRHAYANRVEVRLHREDDQLCLQVADNGVGDYPDCRRKSNAYGLLGIGERVSTLGGSLSIDTAKGKGLALKVTLPLPP